MTRINWINEYYDGMQSGRYITGRWINLIYKYIINGIETGLFFYDDDKAYDAIDWIEAHCFHTEGPLAPSPLILTTWQKAFLSCVYGIVDAEGLRQFREVLLTIGRKSGKTKLAAAMGRYEFQRGGYGARVFCIAPKVDQADLVYNDIWQMITLDPEYQALKEHCTELDSQRKRIHDDAELPKRTISELRIEAINARVKKIAFSAKKSDGYNPSFCVADEIASWAGDAGLKQYEVLKSGMGARPEGLLLSCTTSGYVNDSIYDELFKRATRFLLGDSKERRLLPFLYTIDEVGKWDDMDELRKANPNLGVSVSEAYMLEEIAVAEGSPSKRSEFLTKYCCIKQNSSLAWLPAQDIEAACGEPLDMEAFRGSYAVGGIDLSRTTDLTSACVVIEKGGELYVFSKFWLPGELIEDAASRDSVPYGIYEERGFLQPSGSNSVDYHDVFNWFRMLVEEYEIYPLKVGYDRYSSVYLVQEMDSYGFHMDDVVQGYNLHPVIEETDGIIKDHKLHIGDNDLLKIHMFDSALKVHTEKARSKLVKVNPRNHIDGMAALLDALTVRQKYYSEIGEQLKN